jgi:TFIIF-interacting CTD phosphatase-like protein
MIIIMNRVYKRQPSSYIKTSNAIEHVTVINENDQKNQTMIDRLRILHGTDDSIVVVDDDEVVVENKCLVWMYVLTRTTKVGIKINSCIPRNSMEYFAIPRKSSSAIQRSNNLVLPLRSPVVLQQS